MDAFEFLELMEQLRNGELDRVELFNTETLSHLYIGFERPESYFQIETENAHGIIILADFIVPYLDYVVELWDANRRKIGVIKTEDWKVIGE